MSDAAAKLPDWLQKYVDRGFRLLFYPSKSKGPQGAAAKAWEKRVYLPDEYKNGDNVGVMLGHEIQPGKFLVDVDLDWTDGLVLVKRTLPPTQFGFGRASRVLSHAFYTTSAPIYSRKFDDLEGKGLVEIRGVVKDGTLGHQTMIPPSIHPSGEDVVLKMDGDIGHADDIERRVTVYAISCLFFQHLGDRGLLHDVRLAMAGFLLKCGLSEDECITIGEAVAGATGNTVADVEVTVRSTSARLKQGEPVAGKTALAKAIGEKGKAFIGRIKEWLGVRDFRTNDKGVIIANNEENIKRAIEQLGVGIVYDEFAQRATVQYNGFNGPLQDYMRNRVFLDIDKHYHFKPSAEFFDMIVLDVAHHNKIHPVREYLSSLKWDGTARVDDFLIRAAGAADTEYVRAVTRIMLVGGVRRVRKPGCKLDEIVVLEGEQGRGKSSALRALCPNEDWFSDEFPLDVDSKEVIEQTSGKWIIEAAELVGVRKGQVEHIKKLISKQVDGPVRMAYARLPVEMPRQFIVVGTTNSSQYLQDDTGNRRFWPVKTESFDLDYISDMRDQVWAEAAHLEAQGESIRLRKELYAMAALQQERRRIEDPWEETFILMFPKNEKHRVPPETLWEALHIPKDKLDEKAQHRVVKIMQRLGFRRMAVRDSENKVVKGWARDIMEGNLELDYDK